MDDFAVDDGLANPRQGCRGIDYAITPFKKGDPLVWISTPSTTLRLPISPSIDAKPPGDVDRSAGGADQPSSATRPSATISVISGRIGSPNACLTCLECQKITSLCPIRTSKSGYIVIVRETRAERSKYAEMCKLHIFETPLCVGPWVGQSCRHDSLAAYGNPHPRCPGSRCMESCAGRPRAMVSWRPMASRPRISCKREQSRPQVHVASNSTSWAKHCRARVLLSDKSGDSCANLIFCLKVRAAAAANGEDERKTPPWSWSGTPIRKPLLEAVRFVLANCLW